MPSLKVVMAQINPMVGDIPHNAERVKEIMDQVAKLGGADVVVFPEMTLMGYPPEDLLLRPSVARRIERALGQLLSIKSATAVVLGYPKVQGKKIFNMAGVLRDGKLQTEYAKQCLPNYQVFDDKRYFAAGDATCVVELNGIRAALLICEDIWEDEPLQKAKAAGAQVALVLNASPFHRRKHRIRKQLFARLSTENAIPIVYVNQVGGQDELVFDGASMVMQADGTVGYQMPFFQEALGVITLRIDGSATCHVDEPSSRTFIKDESQWLDAGRTELGSDVAEVYQALVLGVKDYVNKNGFAGVVLGLSGGIDSALTLAIAVDALGKDRVEAVMMPFRYTSQMSQDDAAEEAQNLGVRYRSISIEPMYEAFMQALREEFAGLPVDKTEENLQARCRGILLMSISNKKGYLVLTTGNKSELAVGYATLYGDMAGGFDVLKDVPKTLVFQLSNYRNSISPVIPQTVIDRPPSAELAPDQKDEDSLPPYDILDQILEAYIEKDQSADAIVERGFDAAIVRKVIRMVDLNEYKRRQAPVGPRVTERGFGRDRRYPITSGWKIGE